jgi:hypothetical protein
LQVYTGGRFVQEQQRWWITTMSVSFADLVGLKDVDGLASFLVRQEQRRSHPGRHGPAIWPMAGRLPDGDAGKPSAPRAP